MCLLSMTVTPAERSCPDLWDLKKSIVKQRLRVRIQTRYTLQLRKYHILYRLHIKLGIGVTSTLLAGKCISTCKEKTLNNNQYITVLTRSKNQFETKQIWSLPFHSKDTNRNSNIPIQRLFLNKNCEIFSKQLRHTVDTVI